MKKFFLPMIVVFSLTLAGCGGDDSDDTEGNSNGDTTENNTGGAPPPEPDNNENGESENEENENEESENDENENGENENEENDLLGACPRVGNLSPTELAADHCEIGGELTQNAILTADTIWFLEGELQVGDSENQVVLYIEAGTELRGDNVDSIDHVLVYPGSRINASGTASQPIRFLSDDDNVDGQGEWGGIFIYGYNGLTNLRGSQAANVLDYVVIAEAGDEISITLDGDTSTYEDNLVLKGVDSNTTLSFVQSHNSARDGLQIHNGDPRLSWILATGSQRDGLWYRDFSGLVKDLMVIHHSDTSGDSGRAGIYASETETGNSNPRIVNATLIGRDDSYEAGDAEGKQTGILLADNTDQIRLANVLIANFRHGCYVAESAADLSQIDNSEPALSHVDGVHCANEYADNETFSAVREAVDFSEAVLAEPNSINSNGLVYYYGATSGLTFTGEISDRSENFTASWYLDNIGGIGNGLVADSTSLNGFMDGDTNNDRVVDAADTESPFIAADDGPEGFNSDVASDTGGYDLTHIGAVRGGAVSNTQFDGWTVATASDAGFLVSVDESLLGASQCPASLGGATVRALDKNSGRNVCELSGLLSADATLTGDIDWQLEGLLQVGDAENNVTLTIESGTRISGDNIDTTDYLLVFPGSSIDANGTGARPVRMTSDDTEVEGAGEWGGLFVYGYNGLPSLAGDQGANSLDYVVVAEAGAPMTITLDGQTTEYRENIVLNGVDQSTKLSFVQSHNAARDGLQIHNGNPRLSWIVSTGSGRDGLWYRNFNGLVKDLMVIHHRDSDGSSGRSGIYASETLEGDSNPLMVNITLIGRDSSSETAGEDDTEVGLLFSDNTDQVRLANVLIANFRHGCYRADTSADLSLVGTTLEEDSPSFLDGVHCSHEAGGGSDNIAYVSADSIGLPDDSIATENSNGNGLAFYNGAEAELEFANTDFITNAGGINFTGEIDERADNFTAGWYLDNIRGVGNGLVSDASFLNAFLDGDTNNDGTVNEDDTSSPFIIADDGPEGFNQDVEEDTGGYDLTHIGAVRGGAVSNTQFDSWTVGTYRTAPFTVRTVE
ncbi:MAG: hypothetical protein KTR17_12220 [Cellvibrionaceae bacterium]|nr:hypothetical protein [Cellvibrionaceae bacterium]